jgi:GNAT superfamily N-acetyltransferase
MNLAIRNLSTADIESADRIAQAAFEMPESRAAEIGRYLEIQPDGWFAAEQAGVMLGMVGAVDYGNFAYIGMMVVLPEFQGMGIGRLLMEHLLAWLDRRGTPALLDATEMGYPLYKKLGFVESDLGCVYALDEPVACEASDRPVYRLERTDLDELVAYDTPLFGADRRKVLSVYLRDYPDDTIATRDEQGRISGYFINREGGLRPWMASDPASAERLLQEALRTKLPGKPFVVIPRLNQAGMLLLERYGFSFKRSCRHMQRGSLPPRQRTRIYGQISYAIG